MVSWLKVGIACVGPVAAPLTRGDEKGRDHLSLTNTIVSGLGEKLVDKQAGLCGRGALYAACSGRSPGGVLEEWWN